MRMRLKDVTPGSRVKILGVWGTWVGIVGQYGRLLLPLNKQGRVRKKLSRYELPMSKLDREVEVEEN